MGKKKLRGEKNRGNHTTYVARRPVFLEINIKKRTAKKRGEGKLKLVYFSPGRLELLRIQNVWRKRRKEEVAQSDRLSERARY